METKNSNSTGAKNAQKIETAKTPKAEDQKPVINLELLQKQNAELLRKVKELEAKSNQPENLEERIKFFEEKKRKIEHLNLFKVKNEQLKEALEAVKPIAENEDFTKKEYKLTLVNSTQYNRGENLFEVTNPIIIENCLTYILKAIAQKIVKLESEIQA